jgi:hypothetical protein
MEVVPLVGLRGFQVTPAFSPDGKQVAFRDSDGAHNTGIYTALVGGENLSASPAIPATVAQLGRPTAGRSRSFVTLTRRFRSLSFQLWAAPNTACTGDPLPWEQGSPDRPTGSFWRSPRPVPSIRLAPGSRCCRLLTTARDR